MQTQLLTMSELLAPTIFRSQGVVLLLALPSQTLTQCYFSYTEAVSWTKLHEAILVIS